MIPLINNDVQWGRSEVVIIYPGIFFKNEKTSSYWVTQKHDLYYYTMLNFGSLDQLKYSYQQLFMDIHIQSDHTYIYIYLANTWSNYSYIHTNNEAGSFQSSWTCFSRPVFFGWSLSQWRFAGKIIRKLVIFKIATFDYQSEEIPYNILKQQPCYLLVICYIAIENPPILQLGESNGNGTCNQ
jgi:hypothetical protein